MGDTGHGADVTDPGVQDPHGPGRTSVLFRRMTMACGAFTALFGALSLAGWALQNTFLMSFSSTPGFKTVAISAGVAWVLLGAVLALQAYHPLEGGRKVIAVIILGFTLLYGIFEFPLNLMGSHFALESALVRESYAVSLPSTPISPIAVGLIIPGALALLLFLSTHDLPDRKPVRDLIGILGVLIVLVSFTFLVSYFYGTPFFYGTPIIPIAAPSALAAMILGLGLMTSPGPETVPLSYVVGGSTRARLLRTFLPLITVIIVVESYLYTEALRMELFQGALTFAITLVGFLLITMFVVSVAASRTGQDLERAERKRQEAEEELRESEKKFRSLYTSMTELAVIHEVVYDAGGKAVDYRILDCNPAFTAATGIPGETAVGELASKVYGTGEPPYLDIYARVAETGIPYHFETYFPAMGRHFSISVFSPWKGRFVTLATDITDRIKADTRLKESEKKLQVLVNDLEQKNAELERFTYTVSHDLKSPLITIQGFLGYLKEDALAGNREALEDDIRRINNASSKMQTLLAELLELSRIGRIVNPPVEVPFGDIAHDALEMVAGKIQENNVAVELHHPLPVVFGDRTRLVEVMVNLLENAVKFMGDQPQPRIEIGAFEKEGSSALYVRDNGIGIEPRYKEKVFDLFEKIDPKSEGTGVGLALVKRIIEVHGGKIWVESDGPGKGSCFIFTLGRKGGGDADQ